MFVDEKGWILGPFGSGCSEQCQAPEFMAAPESVEPKTHSTQVARNTTKSMYKINDMLNLNRQRNNNIAGCVVRLVVAANETLPFSQSTATCIPYFL